MFFRLDDFIHYNNADLIPNPDLMVSYQILQARFHFEALIECFKMNSYTPVGDQPIGEQEMKIRGVH